jgi:sec-independent protein translocase protein TatA
MVHWLLVILVLVLLFGGGRISGLMGDVAKGIKSFKKGMEDDEADLPKARPAAKIEGQRAPDPAVSPVTEDQKQV